MRGYEEGHQSTWTNHLGLDVPFGRKVPGGALYYATPPAAVRESLLSSLFNRLCGAAARVAASLVPQFDCARDALKCVLIGNQLLLNSLRTRYSRYGFPSFPLP